MIKECPICHKQFNTFHSKQITCSTQCHLLRKSCVDSNEYIIPPEFELIAVKNLKPQYYINKNGVIWSKFTGKYLKPKQDKDGYLIISLRTIQNKTMPFRIATLVLYTFYGNPPEEIIDPTVNHKDNNRLNNNISNLEWMERGENSSIRANKGVGCLNHEAKLTETEVLKIKHLIKTTNLSMRQISKMFHISTSAINGIMQGEHWTAVVKEDLTKYRVIKRNKKTGQYFSTNPFLKQKEGESYDSGC